MKAYERLLKYVQIKTPGDGESETVPSTSCQFDLASILVEEMQEMGITDAQVDEKCYVYGHIPATKGHEDNPRLGLIAHMDTVSEFTSRPIRPVLHKNYDGGVLPLGDSGRVLDPALFTHLGELKGKTLITGDGTTIVGIDDKAGIAAILSTVEHFIKEEIPHGPLSIAFTSDEEIGRGADNFDIPRFGADFAYTLDGGAKGEIEYENFNACEATFNITGVNVHPGTAKDIMVNAAEIACRIQSLLPPEETPEHTEGYEGFYHLFHMSGACEEAKMVYVVRDHDGETFEKRKEFLRSIEKQMQQEYGADKVKLTIRDQYRNMAEKIRPCFHLIENARKACEATGVVPHVQPVRGGTDGARLSFMGLPCPNLGTGGYAFHGPYEHIALEDLEDVTRMLEELVKIYSQNPA